MFRWHRALLVAAVTFLVLLTSAAFRSSVGVLIVPLEGEFGWPRSVTSIAVAVNLVLYGLTAPFAAALMERFGIRNIVAGALVLISAGTALTTVMTNPWHLVVLWGIVVGLGTGATALVFGSLVVNRWFTSHRGLVLGIMGAAWATGQLIFLPIIATTVDQSGWRFASAGIACAALVMVPLVWFVMADRPGDVGLTPFGAEDPPVNAVSDDCETSDPSASSPSVHMSDAETRDHGSPSRPSGAISTLVAGTRYRSFWILAGTFFVCGWTTNGIISTHFIPAAHDFGMHAPVAAGLLAVVGIFDIIGTIGSGWLTDRFDPRKLLAIYYGFRGLALLAVPVILGPTVDPPILLVMVLFGLDWVATVPPTLVLCTRAYGPERGPVIFGWVFASHMIGAAVAATLSGIVRDLMGNYLLAWLIAGGLALAACVAALTLPRSLARDVVHNPPHP